MVSEGSRKSWSSLRTSCCLSRWGDDVAQRPPPLAALLQWRWDVLRVPCDWKVSPWRCRCRAVSPSSSPCFVARVESFEVPVES